MDTKKQPTKTRATQHSKQHNRTFKNQQQHEATRANTQKQHKSEHTKATTTKLRKRSVFTHRFKQRTHEKNVPSDGHVSRKKWPVGHEQLLLGRCCAAWWLATLNAATSSQHASTFSCAQSAWDPNQAKFFATQLPSHAFGQS